MTNFSVNFVMNGMYVFLIKLGALLETPIKKRYAAIKTFSNIFIVNIVYISTPLIFLSYCRNGKLLLNLYISDINV